MADGPKERKEVMAERQEEKETKRFQQGSVGIGHSFETPRPKTEDGKKMTYDDMRDDSDKVIPNT